MFGRKAKELTQLLTQRNHENELMRTRISELEAEVARLHEQEQSVLQAITEAGKTATRIVDEANANATAINTEANETRDRLISEGKQRVSDAAAQANSILAKAEAMASSIRSAADEYSQYTRSEADKYSENTRTDANIFVERSIMAAQLEVKKRKDVLAELNSLLRSTADYVSDQVLTFTDAIETSAKEADSASLDLCRDIEKCSCGCDNCESPCVNADNADAVKAQSSAPAQSSTSKQSSAPAQPSSVKTADNVKVEATSDEADPSPAGVPEGVTLPDEYNTPAELMHSIYNIEGRVIPVDDIDINEAMTDHAPKGGLSFKDEIGEGTPFTGDAPLPVDSELNKIVSEVLKN